MVYIKTNMNSKIISWGWDKKEKKVSKFWFIGGDIKFIFKFLNGILYNYNIIGLIFNKWDIVAKKWKISEDREFRNQIWRGA